LRFEKSNSLFNRMYNNNNEHTDFMTPDEMEVASFSRVNVSDELGKHKKDALM